MSSPGRRSVVAPESRTRRPMRFLDGWVDATRHSTPGWRSWSRASAEKNLRVFRETPRAYDFLGAADLLPVPAMRNPFPASCSRPWPCRCRSSAPTSMAFRKWSVMNRRPCSSRPAIRPRWPTVSPAVAGCGLRPGARRQCAPTGWKPVRWPRSSFPGRFELAQRVIAITPPALILNLHGRNPVLLQPR